MTEAVEAQPCFFSGKDACRQGDAFHGRDYEARQRFGPAVGAGFRELEMQGFHSVAARMFQVGRRYLSTQNPFTNGTETRYTLSYTQGHGSVFEDTTAFGKYLQAPTLNRS